MSHPQCEPPAVEFRDVDAGYRRDNPVFTNFCRRVIGPGLVRIDGANGAGKSTLVELLSGYLTPWSGSVEVNGRPAAAERTRTDRRICRTANALYPSMTVADHLAFAAHLHRMDRAQLLRRAHTYGLEKWLSAPARSLSTGNARKLWLIMCTTGDASVVVLDEPFNAIDAEGVEQLCAEIEAWSRRSLVLVCSHAIPDRLGRPVDTLNLDRPGPETMTPRAFRGRS